MPSYLHLFNMMKQGSSCIILYKLLACNNDETHPNHPFTVMAVTLD